jgi:hypothetical protein
MRPFVIAVVFVGCGGNDVIRVPLAEMADVPTYVNMRNSVTSGTFLAGESWVSIELDTNEHGCASLPSNTTALFGDLTHPFRSLPMTVSDGRYNDIDDFCIGPGAFLAVDDTLFTTPPAQITLTDDTTTWTVAVAGMEADLTIDPIAPGTTITATWTGGPPIDQADLFFLDDNNHDAGLDSPSPSVHVNRNSVDFDVPADMPPQQVAQVELQATVGLGATLDATGSSCIGPTQCSAALDVYKYEAVVQP